MVTRVQVNGGIIDDQMIKGSIAFFQMQGTGVFANTISDGSVILKDVPAYGGTNTVGNGRPVPKSAAEIAFQVILEKATLVQVQLIDDNTIQFAVEQSDNGWDTDNDLSDAATNITSEIILLGSINVPDNTDTGTLVDFSTVVVTSKVFNLVP